NRVTANLPPLPPGASPGTGLGKLPAGIKVVVLAQVAKGFDQTFWVSLAFVLLAFPMALLLGRALEPSVVRSYALKQLGDGVILGAAARYLRDRGGHARSRPIDSPSVVEVLARAATGPLQKG